MSGETLTLRSIQVQWTLKQRAGAFQPIIPVGQNNVVPRIDLPLATQTGITVTGAITPKLSAFFASSATSARTIP
jgi:hypothetical protein